MGVDINALQYDLTITFVGGTDLPRGDLIGYADPFLKVEVETNDGTKTITIKYQTKVAWNTRNPVWDEDLHLHHIPSGTQVIMEIWDKDTIAADDKLGTAKWEFKAEQNSGEFDDEVEVKVSSFLSLPWRRNSTVHIKGTYQLSPDFGAPGTKGPVCYRRHYSELAGLMTGHTGSAHSTEAPSIFSLPRLPQYATYKVTLHDAASFMGHLVCHWNEKYPRAAQIFNNPINVSIIRTTHTGLFRHKVTSEYGVLSTGEDFFKLVSYGLRESQPRYFTYVLMDNSLRFSETGAAFFSDMMSKHAVLSGCATEVTFAGEFFIDTETDSLVLDNNSGTYAPPAEGLYRLAQLLESNLEGLKVLALTNDDVRLQGYHNKCPSR